MRFIMKFFIKLIGIVFFSLMLNACGQEVSTSHHEDEAVKGPHGGRMLSNNEFTLELSIFETGVPPEFRAWATNDGEQLKPEEVNLNIVLTRLGGKKDNIKMLKHMKICNAIMYW